MDVFNYQLVRQSQDPDIQRILDYIHDTPDKAALSNQNLSVVSGLSDRTMRDRFYAETSITIGAYVQIALAQWANSYLKGEILRNTPHNIPGLQDVHRFTRYIDRYNYKSGSLKTAVVCAQLELSQKRVTEYCKRYLDITPQEYIEKSRFEKAAAALRSGALVKDVSDQFDYGQNGINKASHKFLGMTPTEYRAQYVHVLSSAEKKQNIKDARIEMAQWLLVSKPDMPIEEVGRLVGYQNRSSMARAFKQSVGMRPSQYRGFEMLRASISESAGVLGLDEVA